MNIHSRIGGEIHSEVDHPLKPAALVTCLYIYIDCATRAACEEKKDTDTASDTGHTFAGSQLNLECGNRTILL